MNELLLWNGLRDTEKMKRNKLFIQDMPAHVEHKNKYVCIKDYYSSLVCIHVWLLALAFLTDCCLLNIIYPLDYRAYLSPVTLIHSLCFWEAKFSQVKSLPSKMRVDRWLWQLICRTFPTCWCWSWGANDEGACFHKVMIEKGIRVKTICSFQVLQMVTLFTTHIRLPMRDGRCKSAAFTAPLLHERSFWNVTGRKTFFLKT